MITRHFELAETPPSDEQAGNAERFLRELLRLERKQSRDELNRIADDVRDYLDDLVEVGSRAIHRMTDRIEDKVRKEWEVRSSEPPQQITVDTIVSQIASSITRVTYELTNADTIKDVDIGFLYPSPAGYTEKLN